jgi:hypothetical protein
MFVVLASGTPGINAINELLQKIPLLHQALRDPFTKFFVPTLFVFTAGISIGFSVLLERITFRKNGLARYAISFVLACIVLLYGFPMLSGNLIADKMKVKTPVSYFELFNYFKGQNKNTRIMNLPQASIWGWTSYDWGYTGSGFLWYGIEQPILDRAFDAWSNENENYYWEISYALKKEDRSIFDSLLNKYDVSFVLFDQAVTFPDNPQSKTITSAQSQFIKQNPNLILEKTFGTISLYRVQSKQTDSFIRAFMEIPNIEPIYQWTNNDQAFKDYGSYISKFSTTPNAYYPFLSLFTGRGSTDMTYTIADTGDYFEITPNTSIPISNGFINSKAGDFSEFYAYNSENLQEVSFTPPLFKINGQENTMPTETEQTPISIDSSFSVLIPKIGGYGSYESSRAIDPFLGTASPCNISEDTSAQFNQKIIERQFRFVRFASINAHNCRGIYMPNANNRNAYILGIKSRHISGKPLQVWIENLTAKRSDQQWYLQNNLDFSWEYFIIPPMTLDGVGYVLHFDNISYDKTESANDVAEVILHPFPFQFLSSLKIITNTQTPPQETLIQSISHPNYSVYKVSFDSQLKEIGTLSLSQSYDPGWIAYETPNELARLFPIFFGKPIKKHVLVNNWANGWVLPTRNSSLESRNSITIVFWPQYLEYIGFALLLLTFLILLRKKGEEIR